MGAVTQAMASAAQAAGVEIRTGAEVIEIRVQNGAATGVLLSTGEEIHAKAVISNADPKRTLLKLTDPVHLSPDFVQKLQHFRGNGTVAKVNLALSALPKFTALKNGDPAHLRDAFTSATRLIIWSGHSTNRSMATSHGSRIWRPTIPSLTDPTLAPEGKHVMSIDTQYAPKKLKGRFGRAAKIARADRGADARAICTESPGVDLDDDMITLPDLEEKYGLTGGHIFHP